MKVFIITLMEDTYSVRSAVNCHHSALDYGYESKIYNAYTPKQAENYLLINGLSKKPEAPVHRPGSLGCYASHHDLWHTAAMLNETIIIAEHDAEFRREWPNPEFTDILQLDCNGSLVRRTQKETTFKNDTMNPIQENSVYNMGFRAGERNWDWIREQEGDYVSMSCAYAYAITPEAARKLLRLAKDEGYWFNDRQVREPFVNIDTIHPLIAEEQGLGQSTTANYKGS